MRNLQITIFIFIGLLIIPSCATQKKANQDTDEWRYESQCAGREGVKGVYSLWVSSYSNNANVATNQAKKNAVHSVIFKGVSGEKCTSKRPLLEDATLDKKKDSFFKEFFSDNGDYMKFAARSTDASGAQVVKLNRREYKVSLKVDVNISQLRKHLEKQNIIKSLDSRF